MKKLAAVVMAVVLLATVGAVMASAADYDQDFTGTAGTAFVYEHVNDPTYTVTIPAEVTLTKEGVDVAIVASNVANLGGKRVSVTIAGTDYFRNQFVMEGGATRDTLRYQITTADGAVLSTTGGKDEHVGKELASFTGNGSKTYNVLPLLKDGQKVDTYTGLVTYGIGLA